MKVVGGSGVPFALRSEPVAVCEAPGARTELGPFDRRTLEVPPVSDPWTWAGGATSADLDDDGWLDTLLVVEPGLQLLRGGSAAGFDDASDELFAGIDLTYASGTSVADYDGDGDLDIYVTRVLGDPIPREDQAEGQGRNVLLRNDGPKGFTDVTDEAGVDACGVHHITSATSCFRSMSASWGDFDGDGDLDLFVGNYGLVDESEGVTQEDMFEGEPSFLYVNNGDGTFADQSAELPEQLHSGYTYSGGFLDLDGDLDLDLYTVNDFGRVAPNTVMWNEGGRLVHHDRDASGLELAMTGMGLGVADFNRDGLVDLVVPEWAGNLLMMSVGDGRWLDGADRAGLSPDTEVGQLVGWGAQTGDIDNDGDVDVAVQYGFLPNDNREVWGNPVRQPDGLFLNDTTRDEDGEVEVTFREVAQNWRFSDPGATRGGVMADLNRDGWLDVVKRNLAGPAVGYISRCGENRSLTVRLRQPGTMNRYAVGARVTVTSLHRQRSQQMLAGGTGYASAPPLELHFGLGLEPGALLLEVIWPDGKKSFLNHVPAMQTLTITRTR